MFKIWICIYLRIPKKCLRVLNKLQIQKLHKPNKTSKLLLLLAFQNKIEMKILIQSSN